MSDIEDNLDEHNESDLNNNDSDSEYGEVKRRVKEDIAKKFGWTTKEEWTRDPTKWSDVDTFLDRTPEEVRASRERTKALSRANEVMLQEARVKAREEAEASIRQAVINGNSEQAVDEYRKASQSGPDPRAQMWVDERPWFHSDPIAKAVAIAASEEAVRLGYTLDEQLEATDEAVKKRFPEYYTKTQRVREEDDREVRQSPAVQAGDRGAGTQSREKGWAQIPNAERNAMNQSIKEMVKSFPKQDPKVLQQKMTEAYWNNKGN